MSDVETNIHLQPLLEEDDIDTADIAAAMPKPPRRRRGWIIAITVVLVAVLAGGGIFYYMQATKPAPVQYTQQAATVGNLSLTVSASGPLNPKATYQMNFTTTGQVSEIDVSVGQQVKKGQVLARLKSQTLQDAVTQAQQSVNTAQTTYNDAVNNGLAQSTLDNDYNSLLAAQDQLTAAQHNLDATKLTAPANATVESISGSVGQSVAAGGTTAFMTLVDTSAFSISAQVNEADITSVQAGQPARFTIEGYPSRTFRASVQDIEGVPGTSTGGVVTYPVDLAVDQQSVNGAHLYSGMTATVTITTAERIGVLLVSNAAISFTTTAVQAGVLDTNTLRSTLGGSSFGRRAQNGSGAQSNNTRIVLELRNGKLTPVIITVGLTDGTSTEVLSGLQSGDQVVVSATGGNFSNLSTQSGAGGTRTGTGGGVFRGVRTGGGGG